MATRLAEDYKDSFEGSAINGAVWNSVTTFGTLSFANQRFQISKLASSTVYGGMDTLTTFDLTGSYIFTQVIDAGNQTLPGWEVFPLQGILDASNNVSWYINSGNISALKKIATVTSTIGSSTPYSATVHKWFKIRESGGTIFWDYSTDGTTWTNFQSLANPFAVTGLLQEYSAGDFNVDVGTTQAVFDNYNTIQHNPGFIINRLRPAIFTPGIGR